MFLVAQHIYSNECKTCFLTEIVDSSLLLINKFNNLVNIIKKNNTYYLQETINDFTDLLEEFIYVYSKYYDKCYMAFIDSSKKLSNILFLYVEESQYSNLDNVKILYDNAKSLLTDMFNVNTNLTVHYFLSKILYITKCKQVYENNLLDFCWDLLWENYTKDKFNTLYIIIVELRKTLIDILIEPDLKKNIYFNIDIEKIRTLLRNHNSFESELSYIMTTFLDTIKKDTVSNILFDDIKHISVESSLDITNFMFISYKIYILYILKKA
jgi:hypothetical protein